MLTKYLITPSQGLHVRAAPSTAVRTPTAATRRKPRRVLSNFLDRAFVGVTVPGQKVIREGAVAR
jgi:hypothetical protein